MQQQPAAPYRQQQVLPGPVLLRGWLVEWRSAILRLAEQREGKSAAAKRRHRASLSGTLSPNRINSGKTQ
ncbi:unnamed protein product [Pleuronectes platessa]|uniref:Uncharacterized protein n=1 Tax=Pleuronectes platessa TaxID=8262 RepID=A0A9N7YZ03_PLEPL|nr:unnamed protein product [Pleuronectes platessa]